MLLNSNSKLTLTDLLYRLIQKIYQISYSHYFLLLRMGKRNPFAFRYQLKNLMLLCDLSGEIVHIAGNASLLHTTHKNLFKKNFFKDLITKQSRYSMYQQFNCNQLLPYYLNSRSFVCAFNYKNRKFRHRQSHIICRVYLYRIFALFSSQFDQSKNAKINNYKTIKEIHQVCQSQKCKQVIMIYIEPVDPVKFQPIVQQEQQKGQQKCSANSDKNPIQQNKEEDIFETPQKLKQAQEESTKRPKLQEPNS